MDNILSVSELNYKLHQVLEARFPFVWVKGEVTNCVRASSGHIYFSLKDNQELLNCVWFKRYHQDLTFDPLTGECFDEGAKPSLAHSIRDGQEVVCAGRLAVYGARGQYQLIVEHGIESGIGQLYEAFEALKRKLASEGLFDSKHKKTIPQHIQNVALITAPTGAVIHDFLRIAQNRGIQSSIHIFPSLVQGDEAPFQLVEALQNAKNYTFSNNKKADVIVLIRGGGSIQDLWAFNSEKLAREIFASDIPVITGIGHEPDYSIADYVADKSCATPSHVAQFLWKSKDSIAQELDDIEYTINSLINTQLKHAEKELIFLSKGLQFVSPKNRLLEKQHIVNELSRRLASELKNNFERKTLQSITLFEKIHKLTPNFAQLETMCNSLYTAMYKLTQRAIIQNENYLFALQKELLAKTLKTLENKEHSLDKSILKLESNNPLKPFEKGYLYAEKMVDNKPVTVKSIHDININEVLTLHLKDGSLETTIKTISPNS